MLARFATQSFRGLSHSSKLVSRNVQPKAFYRHDAQDVQLVLDLFSGLTSSKAFLYGSYVVAGASAFGIGALAYNGLRLGRESSLIEESEMWPQFVRDRVHSTFGYLAASVGVAAAAGAVAAVESRRAAELVKLFSGRSFMVQRLIALGTLSVITVTYGLARSTPYEPPQPKLLYWLLHCGSIGFCCLTARQNPALLRFLMYTSAIVVGFSTVAMTAPSDEFLQKAGPLAMGLAVLFVASVRKFSLPKSSVSNWAFNLTCIVMLSFAFNLLLHYKDPALQMAMDHPQNAQIEGNDGMEFNSFDPIKAQMSFYEPNGISLVLDAFEFVRNFIRQYLPVDLLFRKGDMSSDLDLLSDDPNLPISD